MYRETSAFVGASAPLHVTGTRSSSTICSRPSTFVARPRQSFAVRHAPKNVTKMEVLSPAAVETSVRVALAGLFNKSPCMPIMVRLAWHDAGTYNVKDNTGGANASIRFQPECEHGANNGLDIARELLEPIKAANPSISYADLYQLASVVAIEYCGGPKIPFKMGRKDATESECTPDGRLPDGDKGMSHLRDIFYRMGFTDNEITVLSGAHTLGRAHAERSGMDGPWTRTPIAFDNSYYKEILKEKPDPDLLRMTSDLALLENEETKALCVKYAEDQEAFFKDYVPAHVKLSELGCAL